jgi:UDP:flavonoid glycosyltransferase YjiC (YdhE family)
VRILFTTVPLPGHFFPLVPLAWACRALGHDVLVATSENFVPAVLCSGLPATSNGPAAGVADLRPAHVAGGTLGERRFAHGQAFSRIAKRNLSGTLALQDRWLPDLVVSERAEFAGPIAAAVHGIPQVEIHWGVAALSEYRVAAAAELEPDLVALGLPGLPRPAAVVNTWPPSLRLVHAAGHRSMRYVPYNGEARVDSWVLARKEKWRVCVTWGTVLPHLGLADFLVPVLTGLELLDVELVLAVDDSIVPRIALPGTVRHAGRMPLAQVLTTCDAVINHGGQGTALTALATGTPQLVLPQFDDQIDNADMVVKAGAGLQLVPEEVSAHTIARCCANLLDAQRFRAGAARIAAEIAAQPSAFDIVDVLTGLAA